MTLKPGGMALSGKSDSVPRTSPCASTQTSGLGPTAAGWLPTVEGSIEARGAAPVARHPLSARAAVTSTAWIIGLGRFMGFPNATDPSSHYSEIGQPWQSPGFYGFARPMAIVT